MSLSYLLIICHCSNFHLNINQGIPALVPIVEDVFLSRNLVSSAEQKELETQREVVLSMLLRLVEFHEVMNILTLILNESRTFEEREKWKRWSRQVWEVIRIRMWPDFISIEKAETVKSIAWLSYRIAIFFIEL